MLTCIQAHGSRQKERDFPLKIWVLTNGDIFSSTWHLDIHLLLTFNRN